MNSPNFATMFYEKKKKITFCNSMVSDFKLTKKLLLLMLFVEKSTSYKKYLDVKKKKQCKCN